MATTSEAEGGSTDSAKRSAIMREVNDRIRELAGLNGSSGGAWEFHCECGSVNCAEFVLLTACEYDAHRRPGASSAIVDDRHWDDAVPPQGIPPHALGRD